jgi:hypothetical protein
MSNVAIAYPNRLLELKKLHQVTWTNYSNLPLSNITTPILAETARTSNFGSISAKKVSFATSLKNLPYRIFGAIGLINHNLSTSAKVKFSVFNEPPIEYSNSTANITGTNNVTLTLNSSVPTIAIGVKLRLFAFSNDKTDYTSGSYFNATVVSHSGTSLTVSRTGDYVNNGTQTSYSIWYVGYGLQSGKTESIVLNKPEWVNVWKRILPSNSAFLSWRSTNLWRGTIEEEQRLSFTKIHISFLKDTLTGEQPVGTHLNIDLDDSTETTHPDLFIELGRLFIGQYTIPNINPEYGSISHGFQDNSEISVSNSGTEFFYEKQKARTVDIQWNYLTEDEAFGGIYEASRSQGITREVLYAYDVEDTGSYQYARSFVGRFSQLNPITQPNVGLYGSSINIKELL